MLSETIKSEVMGDFQLPKGIMCVLRHVNLDAAFLCYYFGILGSGDNL